MTCPIVAERLKATLERIGSRVDAYREECRLKELAYQRCMAISAEFGKKKE